MTPAEISLMLDIGHTVYTGTRSYRVVRMNRGMFIRCLNGSCIGLTGSDPTRLNYKPEEVFLGINVYAVALDASTRSRHMLAYHVICSRAQYDAGACNKAAEAAAIDSGYDNAWTFDGSEPAAQALRQDIRHTEIDIRGVESLAAGASS